MVNHVVFCKIFFAGAIIGALVGIVAYEFIDQEKSERLIGKIREYCAFRSEEKVYSE